MDVQFIRRACWFSTFVNKTKIEIFGNLRQLPGTDNGFWELDSIL
jgi:hypothetical protein